MTDKPNHALREVMRSLSPEAKERLRKGLRSVEERLVSLTDQPVQPAEPVALPPARPEQFC